jgi:hypothetical protein
MKDAELALSHRQHEKLRGAIKIVNPDWKGFDVANMFEEKNVKKKELGDEEFEAMKQAYFKAAEQKAPFGKPASKAKFSDIPGWGSGSKVQAGHFMTLNITFEYADLRDLFVDHTGTGKILAIAKRTLTSATNKLAKYRDWVQYVEEIEYFGRRPSGNPFLGVFTSTRQAQLRILPPAKEGSPRRQTRSQTRGSDQRSPSQESARKRQKTDASTDMVSTSKVSSPLLRSIATDRETLSDVTRKLAKLRLDDRYAEFGSNVSTTRKHLKEISDETDTSIGTSALVKEWSPTSPTLADQPEGGISEDNVNASFVSLLGEICLSLKSPLSWIVDKPKFRFCKGKAEIVAFADGQLRGNPEDLKFPYAILEVKPYHLRSPHFGSLMRQIGMEMVTWISHCEKAKKPQRR